MSTPHDAPSRRWEFWMDVGGTFTDCIGRSPADELRTFKTLSSGVTKGAVSKVLDARHFVDSRRRADPEGFWNGSRLRFLDSHGQTVAETHVEKFHAVSGEFALSESVLQDAIQGSAYELWTNSTAPVLCIRHILGLSSEQSLPPVEVRLGTTRGTNALLERKGARTAFITTRGFADVLRIANQDRPRLFDLDIRKPDPLFAHVIEVDERLDADGRALQPADEGLIRRQLLQLSREEGTCSLAICLLHAFANPAHELIVERIARECGFVDISRSSALSPLIRIVSRGDTTVLDAYLNPVLREYIAGITHELSGQSLDPRHSAFDPSLKLMTSSGGLVEAAKFVGKDSILSGPAGGVIGFSQVARQAGFERSIGFDMGGTSTDVSRFDGILDREFETTKAGVRVVAPMLAIETVAAGGGSICQFDGVKLVVGPESAGADPGPACYGRGGPLTVTDVNLALGRILPTRFPFPLDLAAVQTRLDDLRKQIAGSPLGRSYSIEELAQGFVDVANANMTRAIRRVSIARGFDPAEYALVTFGGAGGQHACAIARELGMRNVLLHPYAGLLSAYGMGLADVRRHAEQAVLRPLSTEALTDLDAVFQSLERRLREDVLAEGVDASRIPPAASSLDLRYRGVEATLHVPCPLDGDYRAAYEALHERQFGYRRPDREIEIVALRCEVVGQSAHETITTEIPVPHLAQPHEQADVWFQGRKHRANVFVREDLLPGAAFAGPAVVCEPTSTIIVEPDFSARVDGHGSVILTHSPDAGVPQATSESGGRSDPVRLEIFNNLFASIAEQMGETLRKTSVSTNVKERLDYSCALFDAAGSLVVNAPHIPVHLGAMGEAVRSILADNPCMQPGDVYITNDPYRGGSHLPDITVVTPVHDPVSARLLFVVASRAHHAEIGGIVPGSMPPFSKTIGEEGVLIRNFRWIAEGIARDEELKALLTCGPYPTRNVNDNLADIMAQAAANRTGVNLLLDLVERHSLPVVQRYMDFIQQAASAKMRMALAAIPDGEYAFTDCLDDGSPISVRVTIRGETARVDFSGTGPVLASNLNANRAIVTAAVMYVFRCLIAEDIPLNTGVLEPVEIVLPICLLNPEPGPTPAESPAMVGGNVETSQRVVDVLLGALQLAAASQGTMNNLTFGDGSFGYYETICGGSGATRHVPGADAVHTHMTNTRLTDVEIIERRYPVRIKEFSIRRGSGGAGLHRGGNGIVRRIEFLRPLKVSVLSQRRGNHAPFGLFGGSSGQPGRNTLRRAGSEETINLGGSFQIDVSPGDELTIETPGGGGWGSTPV